MNSKSGMTLLETVIAVTTFFMCITGIAQLIVQSKSLSDRARDHYIAVNIAKNMFERAKSISFDSLHLLNETNTYITLRGAVVRPEEADFVRRTIITQISTNLIDIKTTVGIRNRRTWQFDGENETMQTLIAMGCSSL